MGMLHPLDHGQIISSPGCHFNYRIIGPCCRLFDRDQLPWPCCRLQWRGKEPSWRRIGRRFIVDLATRGHPTYSVEFLGQSRTVTSEAVQEPMLLTLYWVNLPQPMKEWWYSDRPRSDRRLSNDPPHQPHSLATRSTHSGFAEETKIDG